jgi:hypothetical protein
MPLGLASNEGLGSAIAAPAQGEFMLSPRSRATAATRLKRY